jgi:hypothetical protein
VFKQVYHYCNLMCLLVLYLSYHEGVSNTLPWTITVVFFFSFGKAVMLKMDTLQVAVYTLVCMEILILFEILSIMFAL